MTGETWSTNFPTTVGAFQRVFGGGNNDAFVTKLNAAGNALTYSSYLGGDSDDFGTGIAVDAAGNVYVTGTTDSQNFPTLNAIQPALGGFEDAFVTKLNAAGSALVYSTYLGGTDLEEGAGIAVDTAGNAYVTGRTRSANFPTVNPFQPALGGGDCSGNPCLDAFVTKLSSTGSALVYSTYLGGSADDLGEAITVDSDGNAYMTGGTASS